ncbi:atrial natriuretic peptide receptor 2 isoform X1 [Magallana gigas]|uniref:atrial natriuretic peptide receptor 2 isoform X1 n=2 Tax=Magallana gigas TaxID=29159 RepID=UPI00333E7602
MMILQWRLPLLMWSFFLIYGMCFISVFSTKNEFRIAWMAPKKEYYGFSAYSSVGALKMALSAIRMNNDPDLLQPLHNSTIKVRWYDTDCNAKSALAAAVDAKSKFDPHLFLGPPCSVGMDGVALLASHWNTPVFGWVSQDLAFQDKTMYSTLVRFLGPLNRFPNVLFHLQSLFKWSQFSVVHDIRDPYRAVSEALGEYKTYGNKDMDWYSIVNTFKVSNDMDDEQIEEIFRQIQKYSRIVVMALPWLDMRKYMLVAHRLGMSNGEYAFICIHGDLYTYDRMKTDVFSDLVWRKNDSYDSIAKDAFEPVFHVMMKPLEKKHWVLFKEYAGKFSSKKDPNWNLPEPPGNYTTPDAYAPYLYDATLVWAILADKILKENKNPHDGEYMFLKATKLTAEEDVDGLTGKVSLDNFADRNLNFQVLDMTENGTFERILTIRYQNKLMEVQFENNKTEETLSRWPNGKVGIKYAPPDEPICGFDGKKCPERNEQPDRTFIYVFSAGGVVFVVVVATILYCILKRYRRIKTLKSMIWQVRFEEIDFVTALLTGSVRSSFKNLARRKGSGNKRKSRPSRTESPLRNAIQTSPDHSPAFLSKPEQGAIFGSVAHIRGSLVSVKRLTRSNINSTNMPKQVLEELNRLMEMKHQNCCAFVGACIDPGRILLLWEYCHKGSLQDVIWNQNIKLDRMFMFALSQDIAKGLDFVHKSSIHYHGNLKSSNCVVDSRWTCKLADFGVPSLRHSDKCHKEDENPDKLQWTAPELLRLEKSIDKQKVDIFSLGIILKEIFTRSGPYTEYPFLRIHELIDKVRYPVCGAPTFRPKLSVEVQQTPELHALIDECWNESVFVRPSAGRILKTLARINPSKMTMIDNMIAILEKHANHLEELVAERTSELDAEKKKTENLLYRMLPQSVADDLKKGKPIEAEHFDETTIYFSDIVGFTTICAGSTPIQVVNLLNSLYTLFDDIITRYDVYKVETIGDAYMLVSGLPKRNGNRHSKEIADCAMDIMASIGTFCIPHQPNAKVKIRIGIHSGPAVAGVVGLAMPRYCLFGDTVNTASRMESTGLPLKIHLSSMTRDQLETFGCYHILYRGETNVKGKGIMKTYFLNGRDGFTKELPSISEEGMCLKFSPSATSDLHYMGVATSPGTPKTSVTAIGEGLIIERKEMPSVNDTLQGFSGEDSKKKCASDVMSLNLGDVLPDSVIKTVERFRKTGLNCFPQDTNEKGLSRRHSYNDAAKKNCFIPPSHDAVPIYEHESDDIGKKLSTGSQATDSGIGSFRRTGSSSSSLNDVITSSSKNITCLDEINVNCLMNRNVKSSPDMMNSTPRENGKVHKRKFSTGDVIDSIQSYRNGYSAGKLKIRKLSAESFFEGYCISKKTPKQEETHGRKYSIESFIRGLLGNKTKMNKSQPTVKEPCMIKNIEKHTKDSRPVNSCSLTENCHENLAFQGDQNELHKHDEATVQEIVNELHEMATDPNNMAPGVLPVDKLPISLRHIFPRHRVLAKSDFGYDTTENLSIASATTFL